MVLIIKSGLMVYTNQISIFHYCLLWQKINRTPSNFNCTEFLNGMIQKLCVDSIILDATITTSFRYLN